MIKTDPKSFSLRDLSRFMFSRWSLILFIFLVVTVLVFIITWIIPPKYQATATILIKERKAEFSLQATPYHDYRIERVAFLQSQMEIIRSDEVARRVLVKMFPGQNGISAKQIKLFQENTKVSSPKGYDFTNSDIFIIQVVDGNPERAARAANLLPQECLQYTHELNQRTAGQTIAFLEKQIQSQLEKMKQAEERLNNFEGKSGPDRAFLLSTVKTKEADTELITFNHNYLNALATLKETKMVMARLRETVAKGSIPQKMVRDNSMLSTIKEKIFRLEGQVNTLRSQYFDRGPKAMMLINELDRHQQKLNQEIKADMEGRTMDLAVLETRVQSLKRTVDRFTALAQKQFEYSRHYKNYTFLEEGYQKLLGDTQKARFKEAMDISNLAHIEFIDKAEVPQRPFKPNLFFNTLLGMVGGAILGLGLAYIITCIDHTLKSIEEVERCLNIPVLGSVPRR